MNPVFCFMALRWYRLEPYRLVRINALGKPATFAYIMATFGKFGSPMLEGNANGRKSWVELEFLGRDK